MSKVIGIDLGTTNCCVSVLEGGAVQIIPNKEGGTTMLQRLKLAAEEFLGDKVSEAIVTVPAYFDDMQRQATRDAAKIAGLEVERIINEPTAAALAYGFGKQKNEKVAVYDLGGGTFDITILEINDGVFEVLSTSGNTFLGGKDFDHRIIDWLLTDFVETNGIDLKGDRLALQRLKEAAERAKCELSTVAETTVNLPFIAADPTGPKHINTVLTRTKFEELVGDLVEQTVEPYQKALWDAKLQPGDIDKIILVGGQTRSPIILQTVTELFGKAPSTEINPDEVVSMGAAIQGGVMAGDVKDIVLLDVLPLSLGLETRGGLFVKLINRNATIPLKNAITFTTVVDNQQSVEIHILQGEREIAHANRSLGRFDLIGIPPAPRGLPQIDVSFEVDANGIVSVSATDKITGLEQTMQITPSSGLAPDEIDRLIMESETSAETDRTAKQLIVHRNRLDSLIRNTRGAMSEFGRSLSEDARLEINEVLTRTEEILAEAEDVTAFEQAAAEVEEKAAKLTEAMMAMV